MLDRDSQTPLYQQIAGFLRARIESGEWRRRLPSEPDLMDIYDAARDTVRQALSVVRAEGRVVTEARRGTWVVDHPE
ncbi:GntR family transcriptional regulator [Herbidospora yilanensis]|uniref:GntR family transcriptional regulator n=1 Tax=Herbidospora yilanensis TaxID=354426 RepID=UPI000785E785|nr:GntR family transcriptional regulator [Herbidospora yilanensis]